MRYPRLTAATISVLQVLLASTPEKPVWGLLICKEADLGPGSVYPIMERLADLGWVSSRIETDDHPGRPPRRYYELTGTGREQARAALDARRARRSKLGLGLAVDL